MNGPRCPGAARIRRASRLEKPPDKTFIGRIERGFDFLGVPFGRAGLRRKKRLPGSPFAGDFRMG